MQLPTLTRNEKLIISTVVVILILFWTVVGGYVWIKSKEYDLSERPLSTPLTSLPTDQAGKSFPQTNNVSVATESSKASPPAPQPTVSVNPFIRPDFQDTTQTQFRTRFFPREWETETNTKWGYEFIYPPEFELVRHNRVGEDILDMITLDLRRFGKPEPVFQVKIVNRPLVSQVRMLNDAQAVYIGKTEALREHQVTEGEREILNYYIGIGENLERTIILTAYLNSIYPTTSGLSVGYQEIVAKIMENFKILAYE